MILYNNYHGTTYRQKSDTMTQAQLNRARATLCPEYYLDNPYTPCPCRASTSPDRAALNYRGPCNERGPQTWYPVHVRRAADGKELEIEYLEL